MKFKFQNKRKPKGAQTPRGLSTQLVRSTHARFPPPLSLSPLSLQLGPLHLARAPALPSLCTVGPAYRRYLKGN
jgi:hypothetical protein